MVWDKIERRRTKRYGVKSCTVQYKSARFLSLFSNLSERYLVLNISQGGLNFITKKALKESDTLWLNITAPLLKDEIISAKGRVIWTKQSTELNAWHVGMEFAGMGKIGRTRLKLLLDNAIMDKIDLSTRVYLQEVEKL